MRRRQKFHEINLETERKRQLQAAIQEKKPIRKGQCPYCLKMIGKGIAGHMRGCNGNHSRDKSEYS